MLFSFFFDASQICLERKLLKHGCLLCKILDWFPCYFAKIRHFQSFEPLLLSTNIVFFLITRATFISFWKIKLRKLDLMFVLELEFKEFIQRHLSSFELRLFSQLLIFGLLLASEFSLQLEWLNLDDSVKSWMSFAVTHVFKYFLIQGSGLELLCWNLLLDVVTVGPLSQISVRIWKSKLFESCCSFWFNCW